MLTDLRQDLAYALRLFKRSPGFAAVSITTLALGMGATTTIFTLANWALLRPVPGVTDPANVSVIWVGQYNDRGGFTVSSLSYLNLADAVPRLQTFSLGAYQACGGPVAGGGQSARNLSMQCVTASFFDVLGVRMQVGRPFTAAEDRPPSPFLGAVISDRLWQSMFQRRPDVLGQTLDIAGVRFAILGVAPRGFHGTERLSTADVWIPGSSQPIIRHMPALRFDNREGAGYYELVARLTPGATWAAAKARNGSAARLAPGAAPGGQRQVPHDRLSSHGTHRAASARPHDDAAGRRDHGLRRERAGHADRLRQRGRPADNQRTRPPARDRGAQGARRGTRTPDPAAHRRGTAALGRGRRRRARPAAAPPTDARRRRRDGDGHDRYHAADRLARPGLHGRRLACGRSAVFAVTRGSRHARGSRRDAPGDVTDLNRPQRRRDVAHGVPARCRAHPAGRCVPAGRNPAALVRGTARIQRRRIVRVPAAAGRDRLHRSPKPDLSGRFPAPLACGARHRVGHGRTGGALPGKPLDDADSIG